MLTMTLQSIGLLVAMFLVSAAVGWMMAGKRRAKVARPSIFDEPIDESVAEPSADSAASTLRQTSEVVYYDVAKAAEQFTSGVVVPFKPESFKADDSKPAYAPPEVTPRLDMAAVRVTPRAESFDANLQGRISSLATMTPDSVEAAVQQAGTGLEPLRLDGPRGAIDDLTVISGVGPGNQQELNELGIYHYWQIASWSPENVAWVSNRIRFPKRIVRENWMSQAAKLAKRI